MVWSGLARVLAIALLGVALVACSGSDDRTAGRFVSVLGSDIYVNEASRSTADAEITSPETTVLFLHGGSYTAEIWTELGIIEAVANAGHRAVAVDLPGFGLSSSSDADPAAFLGALVTDVVGDGATGDDRLVLVSPSASGRFSLALITSGSDGLAGFVPIAPVGIEGFAQTLSAPRDLPTLVVWGDNDEVIDIDLAPVLASSFIGAEIVTIADAGHAAYEDQPEEFLALLLNFIDRLA